MAHLTEADQGRLVACLELAARAGTPGECCAAVAGATRILERSGTSWREVLRPPPAHVRAIPRPWLDLADRCLRRSHCMTPWEIGFVENIRTFRRLSEKQEAILARIAAKIELGEGAL